MPRMLQLNFTPIPMHGNALQLQPLPFRDAQQLRDLRSAHRTDYAFTRCEDLIVALPLRVSINPVGETNIVSVVDHLTFMKRS